jgi:NitT/TauT family transport system substrate-binding protein
MPMLFPRRCAAFIAALAIVSIAPGATFAQSSTPIRIASSAAEAYDQAFFARDQGYFEKAGLNVDVSTLATGNAVSQAIVGGSLDIGVATTINLANAIERGIPFVMIAPGPMTTPKNPSGLLCIAKKATYKTAKDFEGQSIAVPALKQTADLGVRQWLTKGGADLSKVQIVEVPFAQMGPGLERGTFAAATLSEPALTNAIKAGTKCPFDVYGSIAPQYMFAAWFTTRDFARKNPDAVRKIAAALTDAGKWANGHHFESAEIVSKLNKVDVETVRGEVRPVFAEQIRLTEIQPQLDAGYTFGFLSRPVKASELAGE